MHCFSFDIETIPDVEFGRQVYGLEGLDDKDVASAMLFKRQQAVGHDFLPLHQHRVVAISVALRSGDDFRVWTLGDEDADEAEILRRFFDGIDPSMEYAALIDGCTRWGVFTRVALPSAIPGIAALAILSWLWT